MATLLTVKVIPQAHTNEILSFEGDVLKVRLKAKAEKGKANEELIRFLAKEFDLKPYEIELMTGHTTRTKRLRLALTAEELVHRIKIILNKS